MWIFPVGFSSHLLKIPVALEFILSCTGIMSELGEGHEMGGIGIGWVSLVGTRQMMIWLRTVIVCSIVRIGGDSREVKTVDGSAQLGPEQ